MAVRNGACGDDVLQRIFSSSHRVVYRTTTGLLYCDVDGAGGVAAVPFAQLGAAEHPALIAGDIFLTT